ncbi:cytochrome c oxidase subunit 4 [Allobranchiibius sp. CTAmp26]|uniref:cytochrome c oxidase subunit 4 n=1 Tax=Allobranchiibius sp. CTAmp26 TaxID=2815214 RepID=UPI001AA18BBF|nr:cytochrome c oxidase subunit 4 [Allobranchiibius sp. CTAmp26]MBO1755314.1 cytochrome c oxidase subunit 4 [Allobranchiibius sp. CTAmp26]
MKVEYKLFSILFSFSAVMGVIYGFFTHWHEPVGVVGLFLTAGLCLMIAFFLWFTGRKIDLRPDDNPDALISDVEGDFGFFSPHSWWPLFLGLSGAIVFLGLAVGWWMVIIGIPLLALSAIGWVFEYFRGEEAI